MDRLDDDQRKKLQLVVDKAIEDGTDPRCDEIRWARVVLQPNFDPERVDAIRRFYRVGANASGSRS